MLAGANVPLVCATTDTATVDITDEGMSDSEPVDPHKMPVAAVM